MTNQYLYSFYYVTIIKLWFSFILNLQTTSLMCFNYGIKKIHFKRIKPELIQNHHFDLQQLHNLDCLK